MNKEWFTSVPRLIVIFAAVGIYSTALFTILRRQKKPTAIPLGNIGQTPIGYSGTERRVYPRTNIGIDVRYKPCAKGTVQIFRDGKARDIGEGGLFLEAREKLSVNDTLELKLKLPVVSHFMLLRGTVMWCKEIEKDKWYNYGISISEIDPNDRKQIAKYVAIQQYQLDNNSGEHK